MTERDLLICSPRWLDERGTQADAVAGSHVYRCERCDREVWVAPSGRRNLARLKLEVVCIPCGLASMAADPTPVMGAVTTEQLDELRAHYRRR